MKQTTLSGMVNEPNARLQRVARGIYQWARRRDLDGNWAPSKRPDLIVMLHAGRTAGSGWCGVSAKYELGWALQVPVYLDVAVLRDQNGNIPKSPLSYVTYHSRSNQRRSALNWAEVTVLEGLRSYTILGDYDCVDTWVWEWAMECFTDGRSWDQYGSLISIERLKWAAETEPARHREAISRGLPEVEKALQRKQAELADDWEWLNDPTHPWHPRTIKVRRPNLAVANVINEPDDEGPFWVVRPIDCQEPIRRVSASDALAALAAYFGCDGELPDGKTVDWDGQQWHWALESHQVGVSACVKITQAHPIVRGHPESNIIGVTPTEPSWPVPADFFEPLTNTAREGNWLLGAQVPAAIEDEYPEQPQLRVQADSGIDAIASVLRVDPDDFAVGAVHDFGFYGPFGRDVSEVVSLTTDATSDAVEMKVLMPAVDPETAERWTATVTAEPVGADGGT